jgi:hypothetical protein
MKITREKVLQMWGLFQRLASEKTNVKFHFGIIRNKRVLEPEVDSMQKAQAPPDGYQAFEDARMKMCQEMCEKDDAGNPKIIAGQFAIPEEARPGFDEKMEGLKEEHQEVLDVMEKQQEEFNELLKEEINVEFHKIKLEDMPEKVLGGDMDLLYELIEE